MVCIVALSLVAAALPALVSGQNVTSLFPFTAWSSVTSAVARNTQMESFGACMCDISLYCDIDCCCDPDCTTEVNSFGRCIKAVSAASQLLMCVNTNAATQLVRTQQEYALRTTPLASAICVVTTNAPSTMTRYQVPPSPVQVAAAPDPAWYAWNTAQTPSPTTGAVFVGDDQLPIVAAARATSSWLLRPPPAAGWRLPSAKADGVCALDRSARFLKTERGSCVATGSLNSLCTDRLGLLNTERFKYTALLPKGATNLDSNRVSVRIVVVDYNTGAVKESLDPSGLFSSLVSAGGSTALSSAPASSVLSTYVNTSATAGGVDYCRNAVVLQELYVQYDALTNGECLVVNVTLRLGVADVPLSSASRYVIRSANVYYRSGTDPLRQEASVGFVGRPGYVRGVRLLAGTTVTNSAGLTAVSALANGLVLPFGTCGSGFAGVRFLHDVVTSSCTVTMSESYFSANVCGSTTGTKALLEQAMMLPGATFSIPTVIGMFADAAQSNINDWVTVSGVPLSYTTPSNYDPVSGSCSNLVTGVKWTIFVARAGPVYNPQDIIVGARVEPVIGKWRFRNATAAPSATPSATTTARMAFTFMVAFQRLGDAGSFSQQPILPPNIFPEINADVFYPFRLPDSGTQDVPDS